MRILLFSEKVRSFLAKYNLLIMGLGSQPEGPVFWSLTGVYRIPGKGFHSIRLMDVALGDYIGTILMAILLSHVTKYPLVLTTIFMFILGLILHILFCVPTSASKFLGF